MYFILRFVVASSERLHIMEKVVVKFTANLKRKYAMLISAVSPTGLPLEHIYWHCYDSINMRRQANQTRNNFMSKILKNLKYQNSYKDVKVLEVVCGLKPK